MISCICIVKLKTQLYIWDLKPVVALPSKSLKKTHVKGKNSGNVEGEGDGRYWAKISKSQRRRFQHSISSRIQNSVILTWRAHTYIYDDNKSTTWLECVLYFRIIRITFFSLCEKVLVRIFFLERTFFF